MKLALTLLDLVYAHIHTSRFVPCVEGAGYLTTAEKKEMDEKREEECKMADSFI